MSKVVMLIASSNNVDLTNVQTAVAQNLFNPQIFVPLDLNNQYGMPWDEALNLFADGDVELLLEKIVRNFQSCCQEGGDVLIYSQINADYPQLSITLNQRIAVTLAAQIILVVDANKQQQLDVAYQSLPKWVKRHLIGIVVQGTAKSSRLPIIANMRLGESSEKLGQEMALPLKNTLVEYDICKMSPAAFRYKLTTLAQQANKMIVLPEGDEPRTIAAANICANTGIAKCVLLAQPDRVLEVAQERGITLSPNIKILDPQNIRENYIARFVELRSSKGLTEEQAREQIQDNVVLGTLMLERGEVDGLVSGAVHTTANTIRPPLQLIKTTDADVGVSSVFFMLLPNQVYVYGDCAVIPEPNERQLANIAIQSADTAKAFGLNPLVAMLSYSTGNSGVGESVDKIIKAIAIVKQQRPDIVIDGPLQYDAAVTATVAKSKAPNSPVAGKATVFVFPDLNAGNIVYKAVQRATDLVSIGPMLQGMRKPVNDLSRGALIDDIVYTIALTAIQASQNENKL